MNLRQAFKQKGFVRAFTAAELLLVIAELNPVVSEPIRFAVLFGVQALTHHVLLSGLSYGVITLILDLSAGIACADLISRKKADRIFKTADYLLKKSKFQKLKNYKTNFILDFSITFLIGTPIAIVLKQWQDPSRTKQDNIKFNTTQSLLSAVATGLQGSAIIAGLWHPNVLDITLAVVAVLIFGIINRLIKSNLKRVV